MSNVNDNFCKMCGKDIEPFANMCGDCMRAKMIANSVKPAPKPMHWHALADEKPTERGAYILCNKGGRYMLDQGTKQSGFRWKEMGISYFFKITPPEREGK